MQATRGGVRQLRHEDRAGGFTDGAERGGGCEWRVSHLFPEPAACRPPESPVPQRPRPQHLRGLREAHLSGLRGLLHVGRHQGSVALFAFMYSCDVLLRLFAFMYSCGVLLRLFAFMYSCGVLLRLFVFMYFCDVPLRLFVIMYFCCLVLPC